MTYEEVLFTKELSASILFGATLRAGNGITQTLQISGGTMVITQGIITSFTAA